MKNNLIMFFTMAMGIVMISCVSSKKFEQVNTELDQLKTLTSKKRLSNLLKKSWHRMNRKTRCLLKKTAICKRK